MNRYPLIAIKDRPTFPSLNCQEIWSEIFRIREYDAILGMIAYFDYLQCGLVLLTVSVKMHQTEDLKQMWHILVCSLLHCESILSV